MNNIEDIQCKFSGCGRQFANIAQLNEHQKRRQHLQPDSKVKKEEVLQITGNNINQMQLKNIQAQKQFNSLSKPPILPQAEALQIQKKNLIQPAKQVSQPQTQLHQQQFIKINAISHPKRPIRKTQPPQQQIPEKYNNSNLSLLEDKLTIANTTATSGGFNFSQSDDSTIQFEPTPYPSSQTQHNQNQNVVNQTTQSLKMNISAQSFSSSNNNSSENNCNSASSNSEIKNLPKTVSTVDIMQSRARITCAYVLSCSFNSQSANSHMQHNLKDIEDIESLNMRDQQLCYFDDTDDFHPCLLISLDCLTLSQNRLTNLSGVAKCESLIELNINFNLVKELYPLQSCINLKKLWATHNQIRSLAALDKLTDLELVDVFCNDIDNLNLTVVTLSKLPKLTYLDIESNPMVQSNKSNNENWLKVVLSALVHLKTLNTKYVTTEQRQAALEYALQTQSKKRKKNQNQNNHRPQTAPQKKSRTFGMDLPPDLETIIDQEDEEEDPFLQEEALMAEKTKQIDLLQRQIDQLQKSNALNASVVQEKDDYIDELKADILNNDDKYFAYQKMIENQTQITNKNDLVNLVTQNQNLTLQFDTLSQQLFHKYAIDEQELTEVKKCVRLHNSLNKQQHLQLSHANSNNEKEILMKHEFNDGSDSDYENSSDQELEEILRINSFEISNIRKELHEISEEQYQIQQTKENQRSDNDIKQQQYQQLQDRSEIVKLRSNIFTNLPVTNKRGKVLPKLGTPVIYQNQKLLLKKEPLIQQSAQLQQSTPQN